MSTTVREWAIAVNLHQPCDGCGRQIEAGELCHQVYEREGGCCRYTRQECTECCTEPQPPDSALLEYGWDDAEAFIRDLQYALKSIGDCPGRQSLINSRRAKVTQLRRWLRVLDSEV